MTPIMKTFENILENGENAGYHHFLHILLFSSMASCCKAFKPQDGFVKGKSITALLKTVLINDKGSWNGVLCRFQQYFRHITARAHIIHFFLGFTSTRLGSEVSCPTTLPLKNPEDPVWLEPRIPWITSQTLYQYNH